jgi:phosphoribosylpyrophosphate synthetase
VAPPTAIRLPIEVVSIAPMLARAIQNLHENRSLGDVVAHA